MSIQTVIREKRKEKGLTQEQLAEHLGISAPAVNRWEKGATYPDIALLPVLARLLDTDINTLLCFQQALSKQEILAFCKEVSETAEKEGIGSAFDKAEKKLQEYPGNGELIHYAALTLEGSIVMYGVNGGDKKKYNSLLTALYEKAADVADEQIFQQVNYMLASKYINNRDYESAQKTLDLLSERTPLDKQMLQATLFMQQGKLFDAAKILEIELIREVNELQTTLLQLLDLAVKEGRIEDADRLAELSRTVITQFELWDYSAAVAPLQVALARKDVQKSLTVLHSMLEALIVPWKQGPSVLYRHQIPKKEMGQAQQNLGMKMLPNLLQEMESDPKFSFLHGESEFQNLMKRYREKCDFAPKG